jgi:uncharacterized protein with HEPN domain/predicted nucleotidyltransferase
MRRDEIIARIRKHADAITAEGATALYLFGSAARDEVAAESDIDVFVDVDPGSRFSLFNMSGIRLIIMDETGREVDITTRDALHPRLKDRILAEAVQVIPQVSVPDALRERRGDGMARAPRDASLAIDEMIDHIDYIAEKMKGRTLEDLRTDRDFRYTVERSLEILSEASRHLSDELKARETAIPWRQVADFGNVLRHAYFNVRLDTVWRILTEELTPLRAALVRLRDINV